MKIAITGKGGVGKTTLAATLAYLYSTEGRTVLAVDADPDTNLAAAFGIAEEAVQKIRPIAEMSDLIEERTGARPGSAAGVFKLNPRVEDIPEGFGYRFNGITLIIIGKSREAASGCFCPESVLLRRLMRHLVVERGDVVVLDMEAGIEHLTRGTSESVDAFIVVVEPGTRSLQTAHTVLRMAAELGIRNVMAVANKVNGDADVEFIRAGLGENIPLVGILPFDRAVMDADMQRRPPYEVSPDLLGHARTIRENIEHYLDQSR